MTELIPRDLVDELCSRFLIELDEKVLTDEIQLMFQMELAYWYYLDVCLEENSTLHKMTILPFVESINKFYPSLFAEVTKNKSLSGICSSFNQYKLSCHTVGAILLNKDFTKCLLVQNFNLPRTWEFPKGKQTPGEEFTTCAVREVLEETGFDISPQIDSSAYIEHILFDRYNRHYLIAGISESTLFQPQTRNEIRTVTWFYIDDLPRYRHDQRPKRNINLAPHLFFKIVPLMKELLEWIDYLKRGVNMPCANVNSLTPKRDTYLGPLNSQKCNLTPTFFSEEDKQRLQPRFSPSQSMYIEPLETTYYILPDKKLNCGKHKPNSSSAKTSAKPVTPVSDTMFSHISFSSDNLCSFTFDRKLFVDCFD